MCRRSGPPRRAPRRGVSSTRPPAEFAFMPNAYLQGIQGAFDNQAEIRNDIYVVASNWFVNRCPLVTRIPRVPVGSTTFTIVSRSFRPRVATARRRRRRGRHPDRPGRRQPVHERRRPRAGLGRAGRDHRRPEPRDQHRPGPPRRRGDHRRRPARPTTSIRLIAQQPDRAPRSTRTASRCSRSASPSSARPGSTRSRSAARSRRRRRSRPRRASGRRSSRTRWTPSRT